MRDVSDAQFAAAIALSAPKRYAHFVNEVVEQEELWSLRSTNGWVSPGVTTDGR
ncbi:MAG: DUF2750 domain-containing protein [Planctomycetia bacterium]|nr:DUF2750 domain-containing protein [Planctomycetia bacterium]